MAFRVEVMPQAFADLDAIATYLESSASFAVAEKWFRGILTAIGSLREMPARCPLVMDPAILDHEVRLMLYGRRNRRYRVFFAIRYRTPRSGVVQVFHVRHWSAQPAGRDELESKIRRVRPRRSI